MATKEEIFMNYIQRIYSTKADGLTLGEAEVFTSETCCLTENTSSCN